MKAHAYRNVWDAIADSPEEAANLKMRSQLMDVIERYVKREGITQKEAARRLGVPRSRVSELVNGKISKFTIDKLVNMAARIGLATTLTIEWEPEAEQRYTLEENVAPDRVRERARA